MKMSVVMEKKEYVYFLFSVKHFSFSSHPSSRANIFQLGLVTSVSSEIYDEDYFQSIQLSIS